MLDVKEQLYYGFPLSSIIMRMLTTLLMLIIIIGLIFFHVYWWFITFIIFIIFPFYTFYVIIAFKERFYEYRMKVQKKMIELSNLKGGEVILDLGSGTGAMTVAFAKLLQKGKVYGLDRYFTEKKKIKTIINQFLKTNYIGNTIKNAERNLLIEGVDKKCKFMSQDFTKSLNFPNLYFDIILSSQSMYCLPHHKRLQTYKEIDRVLKKNGKIVFFESKSFLDWNINDLKDFYENIGYQTSIILKKEYKGCCIFLGVKL